MTLFDVVRKSGPSPWDPDDEDLPSPGLTLSVVNDHLFLDGLRLIRVEPSSREDDRIAYVLVRLDGREISPARIYGKLRDVAVSLFPHGL